MTQKVMPQKKVNMNNATAPLKAFKRAPALGLSQWYRGILMTNLAESKDTAGAFLLNEGMYGVRILAPNEVADQMPLYPKPLPPNPRK